MERKIRILAPFHKAFRFKKRSKVKIIFCTPNTRSMKKTCYLLFFSLFFTGFIFAQEAGYYLPVNFKKSYQNQSRSFDGKPGKNYWQNRADYKIEVKLEPEIRKVSGSENITYQNNSPDDLDYLIIHLFPNLYKKGAARDFDIHPEDASDGVFIEAITFNGKTIGKNNRSKYTEDLDNNLILYLPETLHSGETAEIGFRWHYTLNQYSHYREGVVDNSTFFVAYFFPRIAVYDDIDGWDDWIYRGTAEFYNDFGDFDVRITVPESYMVWATGRWQNPEELLQDAYFEKYQQARNSDEIVNIIKTRDLKKGKILKQTGETRWEYKAENVTDFAFGTSDHYCWDGSSLVVDSTNNRRVFIDAAYHPQSKDFYRVASIGRDAVSQMSYIFPAIPFPYPKITVFNGLSEMEYPMMVNDISLENPSETIKLTTHEIFHTYFPFYTGLNETKYAWMDEGITSYGESIIAQNLDSVEYEGFYFLDDYADCIGFDFDVPLFTNSEYLKTPVYSFNSYPKGAVFFKLLHEYLGNEKFLKALHIFTERWKSRHPTPYDFIYTFENVLNEDLTWFFKPWLFEYGYVDFKVDGVSGRSITIEKAGHYPAPIALLITYADGTDESVEHNAGIWKNGNKTYEVLGSTGKKIKSVELMNASGLDADLSNNSFLVQEQ